jgi:hypothetical protein
MLSRVLDGTAREETQANLGSEYSTKHLLTVHLEVYTTDVRHKLRHWTLS